MEKYSHLFWFYVSCFCSYRYTWFYFEHFCETSSGSRNKYEFLSTISHRRFQHVSQHTGTTINWIQFALIPASRQPLHVSLSNFWWDDPMSFSCKRYAHWLQMNRLPGDGNDFIWNPTKNFKNLSPILQWKRVSASESSRVGRQRWRQLGWKCKGRRVPKDR